MSYYPLFLLVAAATVMSPGPGVLMSLSNALRLGWRGALPGILGVASGAAVVATLSATGLGLLLARSALAFSVLKWVGAAYLVYLGWKLWRAPALRWSAAEEALPPVPPGPWRRFVEGLLLQFTNPKAIFFFLSVLPQFVAADQPRAPQFALLVGSYALLVVLIHSLYAVLAQQSRRWLAGPRAGRLLNRIGGATFMGFGVAMAGARP
ncbi:LysE family translocator [Pelomonas sp. CA6]|uniref:LysE family translocator n=1 Tax=Pelomonas sp. CA6 TaxID=2907999 RepID=UPI001F4B46A0|nr:LysE family translocator [Pelomonas sp. CA6]MCH7342408.1 LysE family translocator [Pelomonas sp. CA6]